jgi:subtilisin family serine protease
MNKITFVLLFASLFSFAQKEPARLTNSAPHVLYVAFDTDLAFDRSPDYAAQTENLIPAMARLIDQYHLTLERGIMLSEAKLDEMQNRISEKSGNVRSVQILRNTFIVKLPQPTNEQLLALARQLEALPQVLYCELISTQPVNPPSDIPPTTSNMEANQTYIGPNPGVNMRYAWDMGLTGTGIRIRDVEYGLNKNHEEFNERTGAFVAPGMDISSEATQAFTEHGTAVFGIVYADKGTYGVSGMAHGAQEMVLFPEWQQVGYNRVFAVTQAIANSQAGDVIIYEMQIDGPNGEYVPAEYSLTIWNLTKAATDAGIIIVAAAGNGGENLDSAAYQSYNNRGNSGAIIVGGGTANTAHNKISYSTYGTRVDVQGWATNVRSSGYGDFLEVGGDFNQGYTDFSGTSSATPMVASCAIVLQSYYHGLTGYYFDSTEMRNLLIDTGIAQGSGGHIGPIPNMEAAIAAVNFLSVDKAQKTTFLAYPNPTSDSIKLIGNVDADADFELYNTLGQAVLHARIGADKTIDLSGFTNGVYFLKVSGKQSSQTVKIIKR